MAARPTFRAVYDAQVGYICESLRRLGVRSGDVEDLAHDVLITVHRRLDDYDPDRPIRPWLFGIAFRVASDHRRSARVRREVLGTALEAVHDGPSPEDTLASDESRERVLGALEALEDDSRAVFVMHELDGLSVPEISDALGVPLNTLYSRLRAARLSFTAAIRRAQLRGVGR